MSILKPNSDHLVILFNQLFANTELKMGASEPFYCAAKKGEKAIIYAREDYLSSALHEIAHWSIAGEQRRKIDDFGYWYEPEGRSVEQQKLFEQVEVKPQAIEWLLSLASNHQFHFSADNLQNDLGASEEFMQAVFFQACHYLNNKLPKRAEKLFIELKKIYRDNQEVDLEYI